MIKNYLKIAFRNIKRYYAHSILNISGLAIGMAAAILLLLWVQDEWSYDRQFKDADNIYRVFESPNPAEGEIPFAISSSPLSAYLKREFPEVIRSSRYLTGGLLIKKNDQLTREKNGAVVDKDFLKMFDIKFIRGDINTAFDAPHNIILTEKMAHKYFGNDNALGKILKTSGDVKTVSGVIKDFPRNSHIRFDYLVPFTWLKQMGEPLNQWWYRTFNYVELQKGTNVKLFGKKIRNIVKDNNKGWSAEIFLQNIKKIHLYSYGKFTHDVKGQGNIIYVRILALIAIFILIIACINFMNLYTAQSARRAKEIGIRKAAGAKKQKIVVQFLGEALLIVFIAHVIAMILVELFLPGFNTLTGKQLTVNYRSASLYIGLITVILFCSLLAGSYPALYLSSLKPLDIIKDVVNKNPGNTKFRRVMVIFQFSISVLLIICTLIIGKQLRYMLNADMGIDKDNIGYFQFPTYSRDPKLETIKKELENNPNIVGVTMAQYIPFDIKTTLNDLIWPGKKMANEVLFYNLTTDEDYLKTFQLKMVKGRYFSPEFSTDSTAIVVNQTAVKAMRLKDPVGKRIKVYVKYRHIIGVVKDFHFKPLQYNIEPLVINLGPYDLINSSGINTFFIRMKPDQIKSTLAYVKKVYKSFDSILPLDFHFLNDDFDNLYRTEQRMSKIFAYFSLLAIIISCLGLIGLSTFITERRTKEIGIRKANGARSIEIFSLLAKEYIFLVIIAFVVASPIAWFAMHKWLLGFAYRINIGWWVFVLTAVMILLIMLLTISFQSYKAARRNPVRALRYE